MNTMVTMLLVLLEAFFITLMIPFAVIQLRLSFETNLKKHIIGYIFQSTVIFFSLFSTVRIVMQDALYQLLKGVM